MTDLFSSAQLGAIPIDNRIIMAPLTRCRADENHVPTQKMATYYAQRASAGLIIAEATMVAQGHSAFYREPGIFSQAQIEGWRKVTDAVHEQGGKILLQLWHGGRACHPVLNNGATPVAPSAIAIDGSVHTPQGKQPYVEPRALQDSEIAEIVEQFKLAALNAKMAGFDGVEVHGANGYLIDQFLRDSANKRQGAYGGSMQNRARFLFEVLDAVIDVWGSDRVGLRLSPLNSFNSMQDNDPAGLMEYLAQQLSPLNLCYLHLMRADFFEQQHGDMVSITSQHYKGNLICNMGYDFAEANRVVSQGIATAIAFGTPFIANPDLPYRYENDIQLASPDESLYYTHDEKGYTDYPEAS